MIAGEIKNTVNEVQSNNLKQRNLIMVSRQAITYIL
jgi:hypothetical protein